MMGISKYSVSGFRCPAKSRAARARSIAHPIRPMAAWVFSPSSLPADVSSLFLLRRVKGGLHTDERILIHFVDPEAHCADDGPRVLESIVILLLERLIELDDLLAVRPEFTPDLSALQLLTKFSINSWRPYPSKSL